MASDDFHITDEGGWVTALEAIHSLATVLGDLVAKETLLSRLEDGALRIGASIAIQEADVGSVDFDGEWDYRPKRHPLQKDRSWLGVATDDCGTVVVDPDFFRRDAGWVIDRSRLSWREGKLVARRPAVFRTWQPTLQVRGSDSSVRRLGPTVPQSRAFIRRILSGAKFALPDLERITGGRKIIGEPTRHGFGPVLTQLGEWIEAGEMNIRFGPFGSLDADRALFDYIQKEATKPGSKPPARNTVKLRRDRVKQKWGEKDSKLKPKR